MLNPYTYLDKIHFDIFKSINRFNIYRSVVIASARHCHQSVESGSKRVRIVLKLPKYYPLNTI